MGFFTGKGDDGTTTLFGSEERISKASCQTELLGTLDELNTLIGVCRAKSSNFKFEIGNTALTSTLEQVQQDVFIIQAVVAGSPKTFGGDRAKWLESIMADIERDVPVVKTFLLPGGTELSGLLDYTRTIARRVERVLVAQPDIKNFPSEILRYLNRLSSLLYALVRFVNYKQGVKEVPPSY
jgi:cob(I)alamin adenosyltransferase